MSNPRSWGENNAAIEMAKDEILQALMSAVADKVTLDKIFNGLGGENGISLIPNYSLLIGNCNEGTEENPVEITGRGFVVIQENLGTSSVSSNRGYLEVDGVVLNGVYATRYDTPIAGVRIPFSEKVVIYSNMNNRYLIMMEQ